MFLVGVMSSALASPVVAAIVALAAILFMLRTRQDLRKDTSPATVSKEQKKEENSTTREAAGNGTKPFDKLAQSYDRSFCETIVGKMLRRQAWKTLDEAFSRCNSSRDAPVLELGCGTGDDALHLALRHVHLLATDYSPGMLERARRKCKAGTSAVDDDCMPAFQRLDLRGFDESSLRLHRFSGAYSDFGTLNNLPPEEIQNLARTLKVLLPPGSKVVLVVMGRFCLYETLYHLARLDFRKAFRRMRSSSEAGVSATVASERHSVYFHSLSFIEQMFTEGSAFHTVKRRAIGLALPPSLWSRRASRKMHPTLLRFLSAVDSLLGDIWPFTHLGDHYLVEFQRV